MPAEKAGGLTGIRNMHAIRLDPAHVPAAQHREAYALRFEPVIQRRQTWGAGKPPGPWIHSGRCGGARH